MMDRTDTLYILDRLAQKWYGEFGFSTCHSSEQEKLLAHIEITYLLGGKVDLRSSK